MTSWDVLTFPTLTVIKPKSATVYAGIIWVRVSELKAYRILESSRSKNYA